MIKYGRVVEHRKGGAKMGMKFPNVNCKHYEWGMCDKKPRKFFGLFKSNCPEADGKICEIAERFLKPPPPLKKPLTEGSMRAGMRSHSGSSLRPIHPPPAPKPRKGIKK